MVDLDYCPLEVVAFLMVVWVVYLDLLAALIVLDRLHLRLLLIRQDMFLLSVLSLMVSGIDCMMDRLDFSYNLKLVEFLHYSYLHMLMPTPILLKFSCYLLESMCCWSLENYISATEVV